jgi:hypothetical protein
MNGRTSSRLLLGGCVALSLSIAGGALDAQAPATGRQGGAGQAAPPIPADAKVPGPAEVPGAVKGYTAPKTPWGDPDLQGIWPGIELVGVPMQRPAAMGVRNWLTDEEFKQRQANAERTALQDNAEFDLENASSTPGGDVGGAVSPPPHWLERGTPQRIGSLIIDPVNGQQPARVAGAAGGGRFGGAPPAPAAPGAPAAPRRGPADSYTDRSLYDRCITRGIAGSFLPVIYNNGNEIVQGPGWVALRNEMIHETRIVPLDNRPKIGDEITQFMGDSRGHWDGNTLVVVTTNFNDRTSGIGVNGSGRHSTAMKVTERITRVSPTLLVWDMTFDDPKTWTRPWTIRLPLKLDNDYAMAEYACHEGNYSMFNILSGARADDKAAAEAAARGETPAAAPAGGGRGRGGRGGPGGAGTPGPGGGPGRGQAPQ